MHISKKRLKELKRELKEKQKRSKVKKPMRPIFFKRNALDGGEVDWGRTSHFMHSSI